MPSDEATIGALDPNPRRAALVTFLNRMKFGKTLRPAGVGDRALRCRDVLHHAGRCRGSAATNMFVVEEVNHNTT